MKQLIDNDIVTLMTIALGFSKCTGAVVTIKYGDVVLQYCEISVVLRLTSESEKFQIIWSEEHQGIWIIFIPYKMLLGIKHIYASLQVLFGCYMHPDDITFISIPESYYKKLTKNRSIYLDRFFCLTKMEGARLFKCMKVDGQGFLKIIKPDNCKLQYPVYFVPRIGDGNEDL